MPQAKGISKASQTRRQPVGRGATADKAQNRSPSRLSLSPVRFQVLAIFAVALAVYWPALGLQWIWDDDQYVTANPLLTSVDGLKRIWFDPQASPQYYPVVFTVLWGMFQAFGLYAPAYHLLNVLLHALNAVLLLVVLRRLGFTAALWIAVAFTIHPIHVESVAWITELKNVLSGTFYGLAWLAWWPVFSAGAVHSTLPAPSVAKAAEQSPHGALRWRYLGGFLFYILALLSKSVTASLPAALLVVLWWKQGRIAWQQWGLAAPLLLAGMLIGWNTVRLEREHVGALGADWDYGFGDRLGIASRSILHYVANVAWPAEQVFFYPRFSSSLSDPQNALALGICVLLLVMFSWLAWRGSRGLLAASAFFVGSALPALGFFNVYPHRFSFVADHFVYIPSVGLITIWILAVLRAGKWLQTRFQLTALFKMAPLTLLFGWFAAAVLMYLPAFTNETTLWEDTLAKNPDCPAAMQNLGLQYIRAGESSAALKVLQQAVDYDFDRFQTYNSLGLVYAQLGDSRRAQAAFLSSTQLNPGNADAWVNLANLTYSTAPDSGPRRTAAFQQAIAYYQRAWEVKPEVRSAFGMATIHFALQEFVEAIRGFRQALQVDPTDLDARYNLVTSLVADGQLEAAQAECWILREQVPHDVPVQRLWQQIQSPRP